MTKVTRIFSAATVLLIVLAAGAWLMLQSFSFERRFARSRSELEACAANVMTATDPSSPLALPASVGSFEATDAFRLPYGFAFRSDYGHPLDWNGLAYSTQPLPRQLPDPHPPFSTMFFKPIKGNWYTVSRD